VFATIALNLSARSASRRVRAAAALVLGVQVAQGGLGWLQYATGIPAGLVELHLLGAALLVVATVQLVLVMRARPTDQGHPPQGVTELSEGPVRIGA
jgi:cytochrome c oxidase assembly protein subunit 15